VEGMLLCWLNFYFGSRDPDNLRDGQALTSTLSRLNKSGERTALCFYSTLFIFFALF
jgi:hypothetical protein